MNRLKNLDYLIFIPYVILCAVGIVMVYSASANIGTQNGGSPLSYLVKQVAYVVMSFIIVMFMTAVNIDKLRNKSVLLFTWIVFIFALAGLLVFGKTVNGAAGWIPLGPINIQPAEFVKFYLIIQIAHSITSRSDDLMFSKREWCRVMVSIGFRALVLIVLIFLQPDLGGAAINFMIAFIMIMASGINWKYALGSIGGLVALVLFGIKFILIPISHTSFADSSYKIQRIIAFTDPFHHAQGAGQQLVNSYYAISNGGLFGVGLGNSIQKTGYLPEPNTDFIMSILTEELGAIAAVIVIGLVALIVARTILLGTRSKSQFQSLICYGIATYITIQTLFNIGGVVGLLPITGVTFPFVSYGGSSMLTLSLCLGLLLNISGRQRREREMTQLAVN
ncbi:FtsW/RodA/SpoVE family cell cycle protein [Lentilactobacillus sp. Marseille-Q4993]|uniref:FtsW/RodA/SpoVE family cell cycle protein n=1 Tax=Lentilactobacillus sp. Marseille-Q4993 TaxID=3039492 RepID=UPI0024BC74A4|nr:FtsW/RodA/SpoVE family cell cycle protein [Lentilactobacillus sp. Marseille-Q4993]